MKKICFVATIPAVIHSFLEGHIHASAEKWPVTIVSNPAGAELLDGLDARFEPLCIQRKAAPWSDLLALIRMVVLFRRERFDMVHSIMPKTGLLAMLAGRLAGVPNRMHTFTGQVWSNKRGWKRGILKLFDRLIVSFSTHILVDSPSQRDFLVAEGVLSRGQGTVIGHGSICGVDTQRFSFKIRERENIRAGLNIGLGQNVILFLGRLNRDKGILDLAAAFARIAACREDVVLMLVGAEEDVSFARVQEICGVHRERLRRIGFVPDPERYMSAADIFCLPSYREGFGQVIIEAAATGVPAVCSRIYGITDAVEEGKTGLLFPAGNIEALAQALTRLLEDHGLRRQMGEAAKARALDLFTSQKITAEMLALYGRLLECS